MYMYTDFSCIQICNAHEFTISDLCNRHNNRVQASLTGCELWLIDFTPNPHLNDPGQNFPPEHR